MRSLPVAVAATVLSLAVAAPAHGHAELVPPRFPPGATGGLLLSISHGCADEAEWLSSEPLEEEATTAVTLQVPVELEVVPGEVDGWQLSTEVDATGRVVTARWDSVDPAGTYETLLIPVDVTVADVPPGTVIWLPVVQDCTEGASLSWTLEGDLRGGDEVSAMRLVVDEDATAPPLHGGPSSATQASPMPTGVGSASADRSLQLSVLLGLVGIGGVTTVLLRRRRDAAG